MYLTEPSRAEVGKPSNWNIEYQKPENKGRLTRVEGRVIQRI